MILVRSPLRITLGGGGTDLPSYYSQRGGYCLSAAIDKYVFVGITRPFFPGVYLKYTELEKSEFAEQVKHPIIREALKTLKLKTPQVEIVTLADIPSGTGLGSSGAFGVALFRALYQFYDRYISPEALAELACDIEIKTLGRPVGKQDQYAAALGGLLSLEFDTLGQVYARRLKVSHETLCALDYNLLLFFTGAEHSAPDLLADQDTRTKALDVAMLSNLDEVKALGRASAEALSAGYLHEFARLLSEQWRQKKARSPGMSTERIDALYELGMKSGALGGKLVGAGGGGFLLFYCEDAKSQLRAAMKGAGVEEVRFHFDAEGCKVL
jgi:D-glycero-alpha-D-manno-heptose-7-phosphate kinase